MPVAGQPIIARIRICGGPPLRPYLPRYFQIGTLAVNAVAAGQTLWLSNLYHQINVIDTETTGLPTILLTLPVYKLVGLRILSTELAKGMAIRHTRFDNFWRKIRNRQMTGGIICRSITAFRVSEGERGRKRVRE